MGVIAVAYSGMIATAYVSDRINRPIQAETAALTYHKCAYGEQIGRKRHEWRSVEVEAATPHDALARCMQAYTDTRTEEIAAAQ
jgi:SHS2 domain-containing protein